MKSGFVAVVGRPNVGKSTLVNSLVGEKVAITSSRPQTTRSTIRGVVTLTPEDPQHQIVLMDTPGLHKPTTALGERLNKLVHGSLAECDLILHLLDATQPIGPGDRLVAERSKAAGVPVLTVVNKIDRAPASAITEMLSEAGDWDSAEYLPLSAVTGEGLSECLFAMTSRLEEGPMFFPAGMVSDQPDQFLVREIIREKYLDRLRDELPHSLTVSVLDMEQGDNGVLHIEARLIVERESQKGIVIGKGGSLIKKCGQEARKELEKRFGTKVYLRLQAKVEKDWQDTPLLLDRLGFNPNL
jgi:GTP-binding protein Era